jgi:hypothetical protein
VKRRLSQPAELLADQFGRQRMFAGRRQGLVPDNVGNRARIITTDDAQQAACFAGELDGERDARHNDIAGEGSFQPAPQLGIIGPPQRGPHRHGRQIHIPLSEPNTQALNFSPP